MNLIEAYKQAEVGDRLCIGTEQGYTFYEKTDSIQGIKTIIDKLLSSEVISTDWFIKKEIPKKRLVEFYHLTSHEVCLSINGTMLTFRDETYRYELGGSMAEYHFGKILWRILEAWIGK